MYLYVPHDFGRPMSSTNPNWRKEWLENAPRDKDGTAWWVYYEGPTNRWLAYGLRSGEVDRSEPLLATEFLDAVDEMFSRIGVDRLAFEEEYRAREEQRKERAERERENWEREAKRKRRIRAKLGLESPIELSSETPFAYVAVACPICGAAAGMQCRTTGSKKSKRARREEVRSLRQLEGQDARFIQRIQRASQMNRIELPCYLTVAVSHLERRALHPKACRFKNKLLSIYGLLPASVGIASILSLDNE